jgi:hypothetical protein
LPLQEYPYSNKTARLGSLGFSKVGFAEDINPIKFELLDAIAETVQLFLYPFLVTAYPLDPVTSV